MKKKEPCFIEISNNDIYAEIQSLKESIIEIKEDMISTNKTIETYIQSNNKTMGWHKMLILSGYGFTTMILGIIVAHALK